MSLIPFRFAFPNKREGEWQDKNLNQKNILT
nr:hypothetical protein [Mucilaginibacter sp. X4EP1]